MKGSIRRFITYLLNKILGIKKKMSSLKHCSATKISGILNSKEIKNTSIIYGNVNKVNIGFFILQKINDYVKRKRFSVFSSDFINKVTH